MNGFGAMDTLEMAFAGLMEGKRSDDPPVVGERQAEVLRRGKMAEDAKPWFDGMYARVRDAHLQKLAKVDEKGAYELAVQSRVLETMRIEFDRDLRSYQRLVKSIQEDANGHNV